MRSATTRRNGRGQAIGHRLRAAGRYLRADLTRAAIMSALMWGTITDLSAVLEAVPGAAQPTPVPQPAPEPQAVPRAAA